MSSRPLRIAVVGPESSGKTTLIAALAPWLAAQGWRVGVVDEYARTYYATRPYLPTARDVEAIALAQWRCEAQAAPGADILLCDSTALTCRIWSEVAFGVASTRLQHMAAEARYVQTLLLRPDIPWQADPLRSHPDGRDDLLALYRQALCALGQPWLEVYGPRAQRLALAQTAILAVLA